MKFQSIKDLFRANPVVPVIGRILPDHSIRLAESYLANQLTVMELTLRHEHAWECARMIRQAFPEMIIGIGSVLNIAQFQKAIEWGADFIVTPGVTPQLLEFYQSQSSVLWLPGVVTPSDILLAMQAELFQFKFFPANVFGGIKTLSAYSGPFPQVRFCPTGGVNEENINEYLSLNNVMGVGASFLAPESLIAAGEFLAIGKLVRETLEKAAIIRR
jgi:2-dehydro-3-deoxyphosphogluconate aldolase / (4S)-4-hydroxy-2-oxoglutarate aldolase